MIKNLLLWYGYAVRLSLFYVSLFVAAGLQAQSQPPVNGQWEGRNDRLRVYVDYSESDNTERFMRSEIHFVDYVRDPNLAQVHIFITEQKTGSEGKRLTISFIGRENFAGQDENLFYFAPQSATDIERREGLTRIVKMGLMPYVAQTPEAPNMDIRYNKKREPQVEMNGDSWDYWVFMIDMGGGLNAEESVKGYTLSSALSANRITEAWKFENSYELLYEEENFSQDDENLTSSLRKWELKSEAVKSLTDRWSAGLTGKLFSTTYKNIKTGYSISPAVEYNIFPWVEAERRKFTLVYRLGLAAWRYYEITLYDKLRETLFFQALELDLQMSQPWGEIDFEVKANQYPQIKDMYSIQLDVELSLRLSSSWSFVLETTFESIHDQIYLPKGDATIDEILLRRRQLATTYNLATVFSLRFTFGSIYNNIINRRL